MTDPGAAETEMIQKGLVDVVAIDAGDKRSWCI